jgi:hypothetical protein
MTSMARRGKRIGIIDLGDGRHLFTETEGSVVKPTMVARVQRIHGPPSPNLEKARRAAERAAETAAVLEKLPKTGRRGVGAPEVCERLGISRTELSRWSSDGRLPPDAKKFLPRRAARRLEMGAAVAAAENRGRRGRAQAHRGQPIGPPELGL